jgi:hypothetical protein
MMLHLCSLHDVTYGDDSACFACSVLELVDAAVDPSLLAPIKETILRVHGVKVEFHLFPKIQFLLSQFYIFKMRSAVIIKVLDIILGMSSIEGKKSWDIIIS